MQSEQSANEMQDDACLPPGEWRIMSCAGGCCPSRVCGSIPVALSETEGAGSVMAVVMLPGAHLYEQALGNSKPPRLRAGPPLSSSTNRLYGSREVNLPGRAKEN